ncbi:hypothetical protein MSG34_21465, partial [Vibrio sp. 1CM2L]|uniref:hypothetical protein n=1 Tax=Vibrio sp. 1CM2L TaxID=2929166 RepID=UPI0020C0414A
LAEQRIPNPRVGSSNLSTPAIFKALVERLEPFCFLDFDKLQKVAWHKQPLRFIIHHSSFIIHH